MSAFEAKKDFTSELEAIIPGSVALANEKGIDDAVAILFALEKKCRLANDTKTLREVCLQVVRLCKDKADWVKLNAALAIINKRDSLIKLCITAVVAEVLEYIEGTPSTEVRVDLIKALKDVCDGKIYVEGESAKLHFMLAKIYEDRGDVEAACEIVQDVHVETYGSLSKKEKASYILEQMRLNLIKKDYIRALIHSRKMNAKTLEEEGFGEIKQRYYLMMVQYWTVEKSAWEICQAFYKIASTQPTKEGEDPAFSALQRSSLESCVIFLLASRYGNHQSDMLHRLKAQLSDIFKGVPLEPSYASALALFSTHEIVPAPFAGQAAFEAHAVFAPAEHMSADIAAHFHSQLRDRAVQHNLRVVARYYKRVHVGRLACLLGLTGAALEAYLSDSASEGDLYLKIDRPAGVVLFRERAGAEEVLSEWSSDVGKMLRLMEDTCHLINRENMVYKV